MQIETSGSPSETFTTIDGEGQDEVVIQKSRFIGLAIPIKSGSDADAALEAVRLEHKSANHHCFAYRVGLGVPVERFSDDGEPSGTAGRPILEVVRRKGLSNVLVVVTRYFGGTLLGASGLVRAYSETTASALDACQLLTCQVMYPVGIECDYANFGKIDYELGQSGYTHAEKTFTDSVKLSLYATASQCSEIDTAVANWSSGQAQVTIGEGRYVGVRQDGSFVHHVWP